MKRETILVMTIVIMLAGCAAAQDQSSEALTDLDYAQVRSVVAVQAVDGSWRFNVSVEHHDQGWDHYADAWQVVDLDETQIIAERILAHPHDNEQPFTRSQSGIVIPDGLTTVVVRARCTVHGFGGNAVVVDLTRSEGKDYEVRAIRVD